MAQSLGTEDHRIALVLDPNMIHENHNIAIAMSSSRADPVLPWLGVFKCFYQSHCTDWGHLNV